MATGTDAGRAAHAGWVVPLCWSAVLLDGFDLVVLGSVLPTLLDLGQWGLTPATASLASTAGLLGMVLGALAIGTITDVIGRRKALILSVVSFSLLTALCAAAPSLLIFGVLRFLAGVGLGGCVPTAIALVTEHSRPGRNGGASTTIMTGYHVGAVLTAVLGILVLPSLGWRWMFLLGAAPALLLVPLMARYLPESESFERSATAGAGLRGGLDTVASLFRGGFARSTLAFWMAAFMGLLLVYGLNTWLPEIMRAAGYPLGAALGLLLTLNLGAVVGLVVAGYVADRASIRPVTVVWFAAAAVFLAALSIRLPGAGVYVVVFLAGAFVFSAQVLVYAYIGRAYPAEARATGLGWASGVGRIGAICGPLLGGALLTAGIAYPWGFYAYAAVGVLGAVGIALVRTPQRAGSRPGVETSGAA
ncbi:aromatic acid/H+ symport family MFS transporter [Saccharopolyspora sp. NFXS83]|uniref:MFS transporter n=1 Tax=Saccharopolyspora sp. NFXS83 TaxID=2993560 RepID=UPI00224AC1BD|nr:aromatic acid/H+ symport family MFS transporter [Saccharopolyspora sp. NFXS83]MCX2731271.1 aromatic acid/H+ symport family MFS transporter [Saccharopolyspora sp. NFXS83]